MNRNCVFCVISFISFLLLANLSLFAQGILQAKGNANTKLFIKAPLEGRHFETSGIKMVIDEHGKLSIPIQSTLPGFLYIINGMKTLTLWYTPGQESLIDLSNVKQPIFSGTNAQRNQFLFSMSELSNYFSTGADFSGMEPEANYDALRGKFEDDISLIYQYSKYNKNEAEFCRILIYERSYRFIDFFTQVALRNAPQAFFQLSATEQDEEQRQAVLNFIKKWSNAWERVYNEIYSSPLLRELNGGIEYEKPIDFLIGDEPPSYSQNLTQFLTNYYHWFLGNYQQRDQDLVLTEPSTYYKIVLSRSGMMIPAMREIYIANKLEMVYYQGVAYQTSDYLDLYDQLKREFPNSVYIPHLESPAKKIEEYVAKSTSNLSNIKIYETIEIQSMNELLSKHKRGVAYVDMWATWCGPCIEEFSYADELGVFAKENEIDLIYISIDDSRKEKIFRDAIAKYNLAGFHIRASEALVKDIWLTIASPKTITGEIPRYLIVKDGIIVDYNAPHPSETEKLKAKLKSFVK